MTFEEIRVTHKNRFKSMSQVVHNCFFLVDRSTGSNYGKTSQVVTVVVIQWTEEKSRKEIVVAASKPSKPLLTQYLKNTLQR